MIYSLSRGNYVLHNSRGCGYSLGEGGERRIVVSLEFFIFDVLRPKQHKTEIFFLMVQWEADTAHCCV